MPALPPDWPLCGAPNRGRKDRPNRPFPPICSRVGDGFGKRCSHHGGLDVPEGEWTLVYLSNGVYIHRQGDTTPEGRHRVGWRVALKLVTSGRITRGLFFQRNGQKLLDRIGREVFPPLQVNQGPLAKVVREYVFDAP